MTTELTHLLESSLLLLLLGLLYLPLMMRRSWLGFHRAYLLVAPLLALLLPLLRQWSPLLAQGALAEWSLPALTITPGAPAEVITPQADAAAPWLFWLYLLPALGLLTYRMLQWGRLLTRIRRWPTEVHDGQRLVLTGGQLPTSACFGYILWSEEADLNESERRYVLTHEQAHVRLRHTWDLLWYHLLGSLLWFHPLLPLARRELLLIHELQADRRAVGDAPRRDYLHLLVRQALQSRPTLVQPFGRSFLKVRAQALTEVRRMARGLYLLLALLALMTLALGPHLSLVAEPELTEPVAVDQPPVPTNFTEIQKKIGYPKAARDQGIQGQLIARVLVDEDGSYLRHEWVKAEPQMQILAEAVTDKIPQLRFQPAQKDGQPIRFWVNIPFNFKLIQ